MPAHTNPTLETLLGDYLARLHVDILAKEEMYNTACEAAPDAWKRHQEGAREIEGLWSYASATLDVFCKEVRARKEALLGPFAGSLTPSAPLALYAMRETLLTDMNEIPAEYFGHDGLGDHPLMEPWTEVDRAFHTLTPDTPEAATAIRFAWEADEAEGLGGDWEEEKVEAALALALPRLERPR